jgi:hypothetical protein
MNVDCILKREFKEIRAGLEFQTRSSAQIGKEKEKQRGRHLSPSLLALTLYLRAYATQCLIVR